MYVCELTKRKYRGRPPAEINGPEAAFQLLKKRFRHAEDQEHFVLLLLSARNTVIGVHTVSVGSLNASIVHPREVFKPAVTQSAASVLLAHNHPLCKASHNGCYAEVRIMLSSSERVAASPLAHNS